MYAGHRMVRRSCLLTIRRTAWTQSISYLRRVALLSASFPRRVGRTPISPGLPTVKKWCIPRYPGSALETTPRPKLKYGFSNLPLGEPLPSLIGRKDLIRHDGLLMGDIS